MLPPSEVGKCRHPDPAFHWQGQPAHLSMRWNSGSAAVLQNARLLKDHLAKGPLFARQPFRQDNRKRKTHIHQINHAPQRALHTVHLYVTYSIILYGVRIFGKSTHSLSPFNNLLKCVQYSFVIILISHTQCQYFILVYKLSTKVIVKFCKKLKRNIFPK